MARQGQSRGALPADQGPEYQRGEGRASELGGGLELMALTFSDDEPLGPV